MTIYEQMKAAGVEIANHCSDLYVPVCPESQKIVASYKFKSNVTTFLNQAPPNVGQLWYDIPFAYDPEWQRRCGETLIVND